MRVLYDGWIFAAQVAGGVSRYFSNIIQKLPPNFVPILTTRKNRTLNYPEHTALKVYNFPVFRPKRISIPMGEMYFRAVNRLSRPDVIHPTYYSRITGEKMSLKRCPLVITVHDMIHEIFSDTMDPHGVTAREKRKVILESDAVICVSENTKADLLKMINIPSERITVIHHASEIDASMAYGTEMVPEHPYFLYVGARGPYKNFDGLCMAIAKVAKTGQDIKLCVVGSAFNNNELKLIGELGLVHVIENYGEVTDSQLAKLYRCSAAFVYPSLYEGFGIPPLEAMACGTVVIAANCSSIPEVVGDAAVLFEPYEADNLTEALFFVINNPAKRSHFISRGYERAKNFNWEKTVAKTVQVYRSLL
jgi:glycosyltransferase involved in cell wall biosynthesis